MLKHKWFLVMSVMVMAALVTACGGGSATQPTVAPTTGSSASIQATSAPPTKAPTPLPPTTAPTVEPTAEPTQLAALSGTTIDMNNPIFKAYFAVYNKFPRRMQIEAYNPKTKHTVTMIIETDTKDHLRFDVNDIESTGGVTTSIVVISPTLYLKQGATWQKLPGAQSGSMLSMLTDADFLQQTLNAFGELANYTVTPIGPEDVNGVPAMAYSSEFTLKDGKSSKGKAWVGPDGLIIKNISETSSGEVVTMTYDFNPNIKVEAPIP